MVLCIWNKFKSRFDASVLFSHVSWLQVEVEGECMFLTTAKLNWRWGVAHILQSSVGWLHFVRLIKCISWYTNVTRLRRQTIPCLFPSPIWSARHLQQRLQKRIVCLLLRPLLCRKPGSLCRQGGNSQHILVLKASGWRWIWRGCLLAWWVFPLGQWAHPACARLHECSCWHEGWGRWRNDHPFHYTGWSPLWSFRHVCTCLLGSI